MKCVLLVCLLLQAVYAEKNNTLSVDVPRENPADVSYVDGKAPEDLKAGPAKSTTAKTKEIIAQAAFIRSSNREIPKDDEIENEEFERFIQKYHSRPTIETVFVSTSPSPPAEDSELLPEEETKETKSSQVEVFKRPSAKLQAFQRSVVHPTLTSHLLPGPEHQPSYTILGHEPHDASLHHAGSASFSGSDGYIFQSSGAAAGNEGFILQSQGGLGGGQIFLTDAQGSGGDQQYYQFADFIPRTFNVAQNAVKTRTYEIRRPAIQKHYYDIEERVIVRPAGSVIVELDRPVAKVPTGETVVAVGGLTGSFVGNGFQQSQGGISFGNGFGNNGGSSQGGFVSIQQPGGSSFSFSQGSPGITYASSVGIPSQGGSTSGIGIQQSQGAIGGGQGGVGIQQSQSGITISTTTQSPLGSPSTTVVVGTQQQQGAAGGAGFQQSQGGITVTTTTPAPGIGRPTSTTTSVGIQQSQGGSSGGGFQQSQGGISVTTTPGPGYTQTSSAGGFQQSQGGGGVYSTIGTPFYQSTTPSPIGSGISGIGIQQSQGGVGISQGGGISGAGFQQSQGGGGIYSTIGTPFYQSTTPSPIGGGISGIGIQQSQGGVGISQGGGISGAGFQQSQGGIYSTTGIPFYQSTTPSPIGGGIGIQQSQGGVGISQGGGISGAGFQQSQGGVYSTTGTPFYQSTTPSPIGGGISGIGIQQSQGGVGISQGGGISGAGFQQSQGGIYSTTGTPFYQSTTPSPIGGGIGFQQSQGGVGISQGGGISGAGFQQSQGGVGISQGGGISGAGFQQSQGGVYSTTGTPFFPSTTQSPLGGGASGIGFQQSQGGIGISQGGGISGAGFQQSQGGIYSTTPAAYLPPASPTPTILIGRSRGGYSGGGFGGGGGIIYSTTQSPSYSISGSRSILLRPQNGGTFVSTTTGVPILVTALDNHGQNGGSSFIIQGNSNVQSKGAVSSTTTTTERSFSVSQTRGQSPGHVDFSYPSYVEISSNGSPLGRLTQQSYPRMRYQGQLLTGEEIREDETPEEQKESQKQGYGALSSHHQNYENPAYVAEIPTSSPLEEQSVQQASFSGNQQPIVPHSQQQHQFVGSSKQPVQVSQTSGSTHQQPDQHYFLRAVSQPIIVSSNGNVEQHSPPSHSYQQVLHPQHAHRQHSAQQYYVPESQPLQSRNHQQYSDLHFVPVESSNNQQHVPQHKQPGHHNLVAQIRHQQQSQDLTNAHQPTESSHSKPQHVTEALEESLEVSEVHSSTHQQPTLYQQQITPTLKTLEPYTSGRRQYQQRGSPLKYTQDQSLHTPAPIEHTSARNENIEIPPEPQSVSSEARFESSTLPIAPSTPTAAKQQIEDTTHSQPQTYASVLAQSNPGILYAPPSPVVRHHSHGHKQHFLRFSADGSSLFSPSGRRLHLVYADQPRPIYPHQSQPLQHPIPTVPVAAANKGYQIQAQLPITRQSQIELSASNVKPAPVSQPEQPQITRSQSNAESHRTSAHYEVTTPSPATSTAAAATKEHHHQKLRGPHKYRNQQTHGAITLRSGRTYGEGEHRVIASSPAPNDGGAASESVQTRRIVVNHPFQTVQEVVEREPFTNIHQVTVNAPAKQVLHSEARVDAGLQEGQQKSAALRSPAPYKVVAQLNHPRATLSFHHGGPH